MQKHYSQTFYNMKKITFLLLLLFMAVGGVKAKDFVGTPEVGTRYKLKCVGGHNGVNAYLADNGVTLTGQDKDGTYFILEEAREGTGYYIRSAKENGKYINASGTDNSSVVSFDEIASTWWTLDQVGTANGSFGWGIRPQGTAQKSLNNNGSASNTCPYLRIWDHKDSGNACSIWVFEIEDPDPYIYEKPLFGGNTGGTVWTWNPEANQFMADGQPSTETPDRVNGNGPVYKFDNVGTVTNNCGTSTSDYGGIWVIGKNSDVTSTLGDWAGSILVEDFAVATVEYGKHMKGLEPEGYATVWTNGTLTFGGDRTDFGMNDGKNQRWYIGEHGVINTFFNKVTKGGRSWDIQIVVADAPERTGIEREKMDLTKQVMTWSEDIWEQINSVTAWYKDADGNLTELSADSIKHDATGITVSYTGLGYNIQDVQYTIHSTELGVDYKGTYSVGWAGEHTALPVFKGLVGYTLEDAVFHKNGEDTYTLKANITFPFPVSKKGVTENATGIESELGNSKWFVEERNIVANNAAGSKFSYSTQKDFQWYIYPSFDSENGTFSFKIKHSSDKYIPKITEAQDSNTPNAVVEEDGAGTYYFTSCIGSGNGFSIDVDGTIFLSIFSNRSDNQNIYTWTKDGITHTGSNLSFPKAIITDEDVKDQFYELKEAPVLDILEGSTVVVGPSEFANPRDINDAIKKANEEVNEEEPTDMEAFCNGEYGKKIRLYLDKLAQYGELFTYHLKATSPYYTLILPCPSTRPSGMKLYSCNSKEGTNLVLTEVAGPITQNVPYIIEVPDNSIYTIIGWDKGSRATHTNGWLTGVLEKDGARVPSGSYVLATNTDTKKQAFYLTDDSVTCPQNKCYIRLPEGQASVKALYFENSGTTTAIEDVFGENESNTAIYDLAGRRLTSIQKGVNIVNGRKVLGK